MVGGRQLAPHKASTIVNRMSLTSASIHQAQQTYIDSSTAETYANMVHMVVVAAHGKHDFNILQPTSRYIPLL